jgi:hypothetical protein
MHKVISHPTAPKVVAVCISEMSVCLKRARNVIPQISMLKLEAAIISEILISTERILVTTYL